MRTQQEGGLHPRKRCLRRKQTYQYSDLELPASRILRRPTSVVKASLWVWQCYGNPSRPIHHRQPLPATTYFRLPPQLGFLTELTFDSCHLPRHPVCSAHAIETASNKMSPPVCCPLRSLLETLSCPGFQGVISSMSISHSHHFLRSSVAFPSSSPCHKITLPGVLLSTFLSSHSTL